MEQFIQNSCTPAHLLAIELEQAADEGKNTLPFYDAVNELLTNNNLDYQEREKQAVALFARLQHSTISADYAHNEPDTWEEIIMTLPGWSDIETISVNSSVIFDKVYGGVLGKCIGCLLGKPVEGWTREKIIALMHDTGNFPLQRYLFDGLERHHYELYKIDTNWRFPVAMMPEDDDVNYLFLAYETLRQHGKGFSPANIAETWTNLMPMQRLYTAERIAYRNFVNGIYPPHSALFCNPYREWIGALIRADIYGYISAGKPSQAIHLAWKDACVSHTQNGIYGALWVAAILSLIPVYTSFAAIISASLNYIPPQSRFYHSIAMVMDWYSKQYSIKVVIQKIHDMYSQRKIHHWCHVLPNAMIIAAAMLWGKNELPASWHIVLTAGFDTDSNGATLGSIIGYAIGAKAIPDYWKDALQNRYHSPLAGAGVVELERFAASVFEMMRTL